MRLNSLTFIGTSKSSDGRLCTNAKFLFKIMILFFSVFYANRHILWGMGGLEITPPVDVLKLINKDTQCGVKLFISLLAF